MQLVRKVYTHNFDIFFDASSKLWTEDPATNFSILTNALTVSDKIFQLRGYLYLFEVYRMLEYPSHIVAQAKTLRLGWRKSKGKHIDFGLYDYGYYDGYSTEFLCERENVVLLRFNLDGIIYGELC